jgi:hypothetical protein
MLFSSLFPRPGYGPEVRRGLPMSPSQFREDRAGLPEKRELPACVRPENRQSPCAIPIDSNSQATMFCSRLSPGSGCALLERFRAEYSRSRWASAVSHPLCKERTKDGARRSLVNTRIENALAGKNALFCRPHEPRRSAICAIAAHAGRAVHGGEESCKVPESWMFTRGC